MDKPHKISRSAWRALVATLVGVVLVAVAVLAGLSIQHQNQMKVAYGAAYTQRPYEAATPQRNVSATKEFTFSLNKGVDLNKTTATGKSRPKSDATFNDVAQVFSDPGLRHQIPAQVRLSEGRTDQLTVAPTPAGIFALDYSKPTPPLRGEEGDLGVRDPIQPQARLTAKMTWSGYERYYLARYVGADGKKLKRPVVTMFTVKDAGFALQAPATVRTSVDAKGNLQVSWSPVEGATNYQVVLEKQGVWVVPPWYAQPGSHSYVEPRPRFMVIGATTETSATCAAQSKVFQGLFKIAEDEIEQNRAKVEESDGANPYKLDVRQFSTKDNASVAIAVVACKGSQRSPLEFRSLGGVLSKIALSPADFAQEQLGTATDRAMTMADGSAALIQPKGTPQHFTYKKGTIDWSTYTEPAPTATMASVPFPVNGSTDFVKFLASNLMAGNRYLDATKYPEAADAPTVDDALAEAVDQNPYILYDSLVADTIERDGKKLLYITSYYQIKDRESLQQQLWARVQVVTARIITPGMSDRAKAEAINTWLIENATYDDAAYNASLAYERNNTWSFSTALDYYRDFPYTQNATGVLLHGTGVCASYAAAYKALADKAGLPCVFVTGTIKSQRQAHAWNKVRLDGRWLIVDSAWNDASGSQTRYFGLTDSSARADREQDPDFIMDAYIAQYAN